jgi:hypothetical protein
MPRGAKKAPAKKTAAAKRLSSAAKTAARRAQRQQTPDAPPPAPSKPLEVAPQLAEDRRPLGSVEVDSLSGDALRAYAKRAGVSPRDVAGLSEDRLRQNTKLVIAYNFELLTE